MLKRMLLGCQLSALLSRFAKPMGSMHKCGVIECLTESVILLVYYHEFERHRRKNALVYSLREIRGAVQFMQLASINADLTQRFIDL